MRYTYSSISDANRRPINQDSVCILEADTEHGPICFAAVCDGMGGLKHGEYASSKLVSVLTEWFQEDLPELIYDDRFITTDRLCDSLLNAVNLADEKIHAFARKEKIRCGTTLTGLLLYGGSYYTINIGDSRVYLFRKRLFQITKDQTVAQQYVDDGEITEEEASAHRDSSVLTQCVGVGLELKPEFKSGMVLDGDIFLVCSDGFRHRISSDEIELALTTERLKTKTDLNNIAGYFVEENKKRKESDNISVIMVRADFK